MKVFNLGLMVGCALGVQGVFAAEVNIIINDIASTDNPYLLQSLQVGTSGAIELKVTKSAVPTYPQTVSLTLNPSPAAYGSIVLNADDSAPQASYVLCSAPDNCTPAVSLILKAKPNPGYKVKSWGDACVGAAPTSPCEVSMNSSKKVTAIFEAEATAPPPAGVACNPTGTTVVPVDTAFPTKLFPKTTYADMTPSTIYSFAFRTPATTEVVTGQLIATRVTGANDTKLIVVSKCSGDIDRTNKDAGCSRYAPESNTLSYILNRGGAYRPTAFCNLEPNTLYYANVVSPGKLTGLEVDSCSSPATCAFSFALQ